MRNGRSLEGHRRDLIVPTVPGPTGVVQAGCVCGWRGDEYRSAAAAKKAYRRHLDHQIDEVPMLCKVCGERKPLTEMRSDYRHMCRRCFSKKGNQWQLQNPAASARRKRDHHLRKKFGISGAIAERILADQGGKCAICGDKMSDPRGYSPHVDHDHVTGVIRGILCFGCNIGLGSFKDDPRRLQSAIAYLKRYSAVQARGRAA